MGEAWAPGEGEHRAEGPVRDGPNGRVPGGGTGLTCQQHIRAAWNGVTAMFTAWIAAVIVTAVALTLMAVFYQRAERRRSHRDHPAGRGRREGGIPKAA